MLALRLSQRLGYSYGDEASVWINTAMNAELIDRCGFVEVKERPRPWGEKWNGWSGVQINGGASFP